jgi:opacity protein-like surface antigen
MQGLYIGPNFLIRYPMAISEAYPNGRWFPYVGIGVGMHQMSMRPGGSRGVNGDITGNGNPITDQRDTSVGFLGMGGVKAHLFKYVAAFAEAKYVHAHHDGLLTDRFGLSTPFGANLTLNQYSSSINTILVHVGLSIHFDVKP